MLFRLFAIFSFAALASAYQVTTPGQNVGWTTAGPNVVTWERVATDPQTFTMVLVNQAAGALPGGPQTLLATVDGTQNKITVPTPSGGFPVGQGFQVNFVKSPQDMNTILAQSGQFAITQSSVTPSASSTGAAVYVCLSHYRWAL
ncbi:hypothetical protein BGW80DRAFT_1172317 [Lactifluus volemus]|nr:hypothetical protein BGW80DRAFT_1172317 [Lactifluus volemus]